MVVFFSYVKKYWRILVALIVFFVGLFLFRSKSNSLSDMLKAIDDRHQKEIDDIKKVHEKELKQKEDALKKMQETISTIEVRYKESQRELDAEKLKEIEKIVKETQDDPEKLAQRLQESTGFKIMDR